MPGFEGFMENIRILRSSAPARNKIYEKHKLLSRVVGGVGKVTGGLSRMVGWAQGSG